MAAAGDRTPPPPRSRRGDQPDIRNPSPRLPFQFRLESYDKEEEISDRTIPWSLMGQRVTPAADAPVAPVDPYAHGDVGADSI